MDSLTQLALGAAVGEAVASHTFRYRPDLLSTHQQLRALEGGATLGEGDEAGAPALLAQGFGPVVGVAHLPGYFLGT